MSTGAIYVGVSEIGECGGLGILFPDEDMDQAREIVRAAVEYRPRTEGFETRTDGRA
jgi:hypothetical protein